MSNTDSAEPTNYDLLQRMIKLSDAIQRLSDTQQEHGKTLNELSASASDIADDVARIVESLPDN